MMMILRKVPNCVCLCQLLVCQGAGWQSLSVSLLMIIIILIIIIFIVTVVTIIIISGSFIMNMIMITLCVTGKIT